MRLNLPIANCILFKNTNESVPNSNTLALFLCDCHAGEHYSRISKGACCSTLRQLKSRGVSRSRDSFPRAWRPQMSTTQGPGPRIKSSHEALAQFMPLVRGKNCVRAASVNTPSSDQGLKQAGLTCPCRSGYASRHSQGHWLLCPVEGLACCKHNMKPKQVISHSLLCMSHSQIPLPNSIWSSVCSVKSVSLRHFSSHSWTAKCS